MSGTVYGMLVILAAGAIGSATLLPMKFVKNWKWENSWLVYASLAYLVAPLLVAWITIPRLGEVYADAGLSNTAPVALFGFGWGISVVMLGLAVAAVGLSVSTGIIMGSSIALGSLVPLLWLKPGEISTEAGMRVLLADAIILAGVILCARAGFLRERVQPSDASQPMSGTTGIALCFVAGILTTLLNIALARGGEVTRLAIEYGATAQNSNNAVWGLGVSAGAIPSVVFCIVLLTRNGTWSVFSAPAGAWNALLCVGMATFFITATVGYGMGASAMGALGPAIGWPVYLSSLIIGNNFWGWFTGEWRDAPRAAFLTMIAGIALQIAGIATLFGGGPSEG